MQMYHQKNSKLMFSTESKNSAQNWRRSNVLFKMQQTRVEHRLLRRLQKLLSNSEEGSIIELLQTSHSAMTVIQNHVDVQFQGWSVGLAPHLARVARRTWQERSASTSGNCDAWSLMHCRYHQSNINRITTLPSDVINVSLHIPVMRLLTCMSSVKIDDKLCLHGSNC